MPCRWRISTLDGRSGAGPHEHLTNPRAAQHADEFPRRRAGRHNVIDDGDRVETVQVLAHAESVRDVLPSLSRSL
jgi:hypothetical protein